MVEPRDHVGVREAPCISFSTTSLNAPSIWNAEASARRSIQNTPKRAVVRQQLAGPDRVDVLGRQREADDPQLAATAVDHRAERVAGAQAVRAGERLAGEHLVGMRRRRSCALTRRKTSQSAARRPAGIEISRPVAGSVIPGTSSVTSSTTRVSTCATPGIASMSGWSDERRARQRREDVAEAVTVVVGAQRQVERVEGREHRDEDGDAGRDDQGDGDRLPSDGPQVAQQLAVERRQARGGGRRAGSPPDLPRAARTSFAWSLTMRPSASVTTRSPMPAIAALWVITATVVPSSRLTRASASSTTTPVVMSSAPVGSSQSRTSGRLAIARAMATRCCSPPDICAGKVVGAVREAHQGERVGRRHRVVGDLGDQVHVLAGREARDQVVELEDEADACAGGTR